MMDGHHEGLHTHPAVLGHALADGWVRCDLCAHRCRLRPGRTGICARANQRQRCAADASLWPGDYQRTSIPWKRSHSIIFSRAPASSPLPPLAATSIVASARTGTSHRSARIRMDRWPAIHSCPTRLWARPSVQVVGAWPSPIASRPSSSNTPTTWRCWRTGPGLRLSLSPTDTKHPKRSR